LAARKSDRACDPLGGHRRLRRVVPRLLQGRSAWLLEQVVSRGTGSRREPACCGLPLTRLRRPA